MLNIGSSGTIFKQKTNKYTGVMVARKLLNPQVLADVDSIDSWLHDLQIWKCVPEAASSCNLLITF